MDALFIMLRNVILFVALAIPGYLLVKTGQLKQEQSVSLSKMMMYMGMPFLIFSSTISKMVFNKELLLSFAFVAVVGVIYTLFMFFASKPLSAVEKDAKKNGMMRFCEVFANNGFLGIPLAMAVFGADSPVMTVLIILNILTNIMMYTLGIYLVTGDKSKMSIKKGLLNPALIAFVFGIIFNLLDVKSFIPEVATYATHFSNIVTPVSMTILGMKMGSVNLSALFAKWTTYFVSLIRLVVFPVIITAIVFVLKLLFPGSFIDGNMVLGFFIAFSMPTAGLASTLADGFGGDTENAVAFTLGTTILSILTIPVLYWLICMVI